jgi:hypothetical protein
MWRAAPCLPPALITARRRIHVERCAFDLVRLRLTRAIFVSKLY